jgi:hypothetical protein
LDPTTLILTVTYAIRAVAHTTILSVAESCNATWPPHPWRCQRGPTIMVVARSPVPSPSTGHEFATISPIETMASLTLAAARDCPKPQLRYRVGAEYNRGCVP